MQKFVTLTSKAIPLRAENVDTDQIIPAKYLTAVTRAGMGDGMFANWRYLSDGSLNPDFVINKAEYAGAQIVVAGRNFGSGSSREHAVWALTEYGFRVIISPMFADIFYSNSLKNGLLPVVLPEEVVHNLWETLEQDTNAQVTVDLQNNLVHLPDGSQHSFSLDPFRRLCLLEGVDDLGYLLLRAEKVVSYEMAQGK